MSQSIDEDLVIKDIDSPLYKYFYFYRIDIKNCFASDRQKFVQKIKSNILWIYLVMRDSQKYTIDSTIDSMPGQ
jgi:hypothetical protein